MGDGGTGVRARRSGSRWLVPLAAMALAVGAGCSSDGEADAAAPPTTLEPSTTTEAERTLEPLAFTATSTTTFASDAPCGDGGQALRATGEGTSPELDSYTLVASHCTALPSGQLTDGEVTYTLADGDRITGTYVGRCDLTDLAAAPCRLDITVDGGTGRFVEASGSVVVESVVDVLAGTGQEAVSGTLSGVAPSDDLPRR